MNLKHSTKNVLRKPDDIRFKNSNSSRAKLDVNDQKVNNPHEGVQTPSGESVSAFIYNDDYEDDPSAILAAQMGQFTFGYMGAPPVQNGQVSPERSKVIQEILRNFDLERVMSRYRGNTVFNSYCHSLKNTHFRSCLEQIMGREKAPFDDQKWNDKLMRKVMVDLERKLDENERKLEEAENQRILKLKLLGICNGESWEEEDKKRHPPKPLKKTAAERKLEKRNKLARESVFRPSDDIETQMAILHRAENHVKRRSASNNSSAITISCSSNNNNDDDDVIVNLTHKKDNDDGEKQGNIHETQDAQTEPNCSRSSLSERREAYRQLKKLYEEEDLEELYREAENLVRPSQMFKK
ncbi:hypothetical protein EGW08_022592 [Elysia chlorotica]|uniref:Uncharacterized protein n=1 Tax=Elysia chlorotica TaxID=188477 RepID=A0A433SKL4_ELYCH|nr:hypothetical protein EGW08_022592 [Elysia chlorotica]